MRSERGLSLERWYDKVLRLPALRVARRVLVVLLGGGAICLTAGSGCPNAADILSQALGESDVEQALTGAFTVDTVMIRIVNESGYDAELDMLIDDVQYRLTCEATQVVCDTVLDACPEVVEPVVERRLDEEGVLMGGRRFNSNEVFIFRQADDEFSCGSTLLYKLNLLGIEVEAIKRL